MLAAHVRLALGNLDLDVELCGQRGEVVAILGPNGAGKTTLLRALAGLQRLDSGHVTLDEVVLDDPATGTFVAPADRGVGVVFQDYLLFPHLSALDNVAFGLTAHGAPRRDGRRRALSILTSLGLLDVVDQRPAALSGGQAQRVALGRALAIEPSLLLLDEPLSALDASTRSFVRRDLRAHLSSFEGVTVLVTHDPVDALALADHVVIVEGGAVTQAGTIAEVTTRPRTRYVADLVGVTLLRGVADGHTVRLAGGSAVDVADPVDGPTLVMIRPSSVSLHHQRHDTSARNQWSCRIAGFDLLGDRVRVRLDGEVGLVAEVTPASVAAMGLRDGDEVWATVKATDLVTYSE